MADSRSTILPIREACFINPDANMDSQDTESRKEIEQSTAYPDPSSKAGNPLTRQPTTIYVVTINITQNEKWEYGKVEPKAAFADLEYANAYAEYTLLSMVLHIELKNDIEFPPEVFEVPTGSDSSLDKLEARIEELEGRYEEALKARQEERGRYRTELDRYEHSHEGCGCYEVRNSEGEIMVRAFVTKMELYK